MSFGLGRPGEPGQVIAGLATEVVPAVAAGRVRPVVDGVQTFGRAAEASPGCAATRRMARSFSVPRCRAPMP
ncbi:hypothetical protein ACFVH0_23625 [Streptomyces sp. NPDC127117]|uniref:hypothetical protein n=1 Tax=Streptomyces sp. NPDC127117 TaxID=3345368 RepID=UPI003632AA1F